MNEKQRSKPPPPRPPAEFGRRAIELAASIGKSKRDLARAAGRAGGPKDPTVDRLARGEGSMAFARDVRDALRGWGLDVSTLPPLLDEEQPAPDWAREWLEIGETLHRLAPPERYDLELARLRKIAEAFRIVAGEMSELARR